MVDGRHRSRRRQSCRCCRHHRRGDDRRDYAKATQRRIVNDRRGCRYRRFRFDYANDFQIVAITPGLLAQAMTLAEKHALRGYDAVQLAAALTTQTRRQARRLPSLTLLSADADLNAAGMAEGLNIDNPNDH